MIRIAEDFTAFTRVLMVLARWNAPDEWNACGGLEINATSSPPGSSELRRDQSGSQSTRTPFVMLNVAGVQKGRELR